ncbi:Hypothetical protein NocV09_01400590 [Nannochloropsis oceanica]
MGDSVREMMRQAAKQKQKKADALAAALKNSKGKEQILALMRQKVAKTAPQAASASPPARSPAPPPVAAAPPPVAAAPAAPGAHPTPHRSAAARSTGMLPGFEPVDSDDEDEDEKGMAKTAVDVPAALPPGFFDSGMEEEGAEEEEGDEENEPLPIPPHSPSSHPPPPPSTNDTTALPTGFFDDPDADAAAHNIDLVAQKEAAVKAEWEEFQKFAAAVVMSEADQEAEEEAEREEEEQRKELEHMYYTARLAGLMATSGEAAGRRGKKGERNRGQEKEGGGREDALAAIEGVPSKREAPALVAGAVEDEGEEEREGEVKRRDVQNGGGGESASFEISAMLRAKKKRKKEVMEEAFEKDYVPFDPLDWRAKTFG